MNKLTLNQITSLKEYAITVSKLKQLLSNLNDDDMVYIAQEGYYCDESFADISVSDKPDYIDGDVKYYEIASISQWP